LISSVEATYNFGTDIVQPAGKGRTSAMKEWENYFALTGTGAVTLVGLLFVVITLGAERVKRGDEWLLQTFLTPTLVHFGVVFLIALLTLGWPEGDSLILPFGLIGIAGLAYSLSIAAQAARSNGLFSDAFLFHGGIPIVCYVGIITAAWLGVNSTRQTYLALRAVSALLLITGMRNAWAAAVDITRRNSK
jgi:hypothetical protein